jgi:hypothetical protein
MLGRRLRLWEALHRNYHARKSLWIKSWKQCVRNWRNILLRDGILTNEREWLESIVWNQIAKVPSLLVAWEWLFDLVLSCRGWLSYTARPAVLDFEPGENIHGSITFAFRGGFGLFWATLYLQFWIITQILIGCVEETCYFGGFSVCKLIFSPLLVLNKDLFTAQRRF